MIDRLRTHLIPAGYRALQLALALPMFAVPLMAQWTAPTPEELSMTSQPQVPGAPAVYLFREETSEDNLHMYSVYVRLKVLAEAGKEQANVELRYFAGSDVNNTVDSIAGRTIEPDGRVVPFTGKPYQKLIVKGQGVRYMAKVFTMPEVEVGSILEYRYKLRWDDRYYKSPEWYVQSDYFVRRAHFQWRPSNTVEYLTNDRGQLIGTIAWTNILPAGAKLEQTKLPPVGQREGQTIFDLNVHDIAPQPQEDYMPPVSSFSYRVQFYYTAFRTAPEFWKSEGNYWAKKQDKLIGPGSAVRSAAAELTAGADTPDAKLRKLYAAVQGFENTDFTRQHSSAEEKSEGFREVRTTEDVLARKRGDSDQLAELFIALARAAGFRAYPMILASRDRRIFYPAYTTFQQFDDVVAIVDVDGKEVFFDPGSRFCPYGHLAWKHTLAGGVREVDGGSVLANTPGESYTASRIQRVANLTMDEHGAVHGTAKLTFIGSPAISWRQHSLEGDDSSLNRELQEHLERMLPHGMEVKVTSIDKLTDYEQPLTVNYDVSGLPGFPTGKRLVVPSDLFEANSRSTFPHEKRESAVYFEYPHVVQDALRINFPPTFTIESMPKTEGQSYAKDAAYKITTEQKPTSYTVRREFVLGEIVFMQKDYPDLRSFYNKVETRDQESLVLKVGEGGGSKSDTATSTHP